METVVGVFPSRFTAERGASSLRSQGIPFERIQLLLPETARSDVAALPTEETEQPGVGRAVGGVVGGAAGASAGWGLGSVVASLLVPGVGPVTAIGLAAAALFGAGGAIGGAKAGEALEEKSQEGLPKDEVYLYEDALAHGRAIVFLEAESDEEADRARRALAAAGAESLDAARESWWVGIREPEKEHYEKAGGDFDADERHYRRGFVAALHPDCRGKGCEEIPPHVRERYRESIEREAFRRGYERGARQLADARAGELVETAQLR
jgi:hypothetical protein